MQICADIEACAGEEQWDPGEPALKGAHCSEHAYDESRGSEWRSSELTA